MRVKVGLFYLLAALCLGVAASKGEGGREGRGEEGPGPGPPRPGPPRPGPPGPPDHGEVCRNDFMRFCAFRVPDMNNMEDIIKCMNTHLSDLNPMCKDKVENATAALLSFHAACDASLEAQCPEAIGNSMHTGKCVVEHLADLQHGCLLEISKLLVERMQHRGPPGPPPHYPPMDEFWYTVSTGMDSQEFAKDTQEAMNEDEDEGRGRKKPAGSFFAGVAGGMTVVFFVGILICMKHRCVGRGRCQNAHLCHHASNLQTPLAPQFLHGYHQMGPPSVGVVVKGMPENGNANGKV